MPPEAIADLQLTIYLFAFLFGAVWGSFLNVVVYRLPAKLSLLHPPSRCPSCETPIKPYDNVPILGWLWLRGRCRACRVPISPRYPLVELTMALLSLALAYKVFDGRLGREDIFILIVPYAFLFAFVFLLLALFLIDLDTTELPHELTIPGIVLGVLYALLTDKAWPLVTLTPNIVWSDALLGAMIGGGLIIAIIVIYYLLRGQIGMGGGDIYMMAMVGAFVGWQGLFFIFLASSLQGILAAVGAAILGLGQSDAAADEHGVARATGFFRNRDVESMHAALSTDAEHKPDISQELAEIDHDLGHTSQADQAPSAEHALDAVEPAMGKLAIPFGPFIALSAVEYVFFGHLILPIMTSGVLGPNGFLL